MLEGILAMEEEHADDLVTLLEELGKSARPTTDRDTARRPRSSPSAAAKPARARPAGDSNRAIAGRGRAGRGAAKLRGRRG
jgi:hypothetical protein